MILKSPCLTWTLGSALCLASVVHDQVHPLRNKHYHYNQSLNLLAEYRSGQIVLSVSSLQPFPANSNPSRRSQSPVAAYLLLLPE